MWVDPPFQLVKAVSETLLAELSNSKTDRRLSTNKVLHKSAAQLYAIEEAIPFSALVANAISQDGDALFPLMAIDMKAAIIATIYTTIPGVITGVLVYYFWPYAQFGFAVLG